MNDTMNKRPAFQFYPGDWRRDTQVQMANMETRGVWFEMLCCMHDAPERGKIRGTHKQIVTLLGCAGDELTRSLKEIEALHIGNVTHGNDIITITNRRMYNEDQAEIKAREQTKKRVAKHRAQKARNDEVTPPSSSSASSSVSSSPSKKKKNPPKPPQKWGCVECVFHFYCEALKKNPNRYTLTPKKRKKIATRLKDSTVQEIHNAILTCRDSPHHSGENDRNEKYQDLITNIIPDRDKIEWWNDRYVETLVVAEAESPEDMAKKANICSDDWR